MPLNILLPDYCQTTCMRCWLMSCQLLAALRSPTLILKLPLTTTTRHDDTSLRRLHVLELRHLAR
jgi:hypothetical protein